MPCWRAVVSLTALFVVLANWSGSGRVLSLASVAVIACIGSSASPSLIAAVGAVLLPSCPCPWWRVDKTQLRDERHQA